ncbi:hypothetical protein KAW80_04175 [Candidatus Babeliales bacterium]|nr:hypothetical protein [Candidatus Babeliales bacterium]
MNIKTLRILVFLSLTSFFTGCSRKGSGRLAENYYKLSLDYLEGGSLQGYKQSLYYLDKAILNNSQGNYYALKATLLLRLGKEDEAEDAFKESLSKDMNSKVKADVLNNYACLLAEQDRGGEAYSLWQKLSRSKHYMTPEVALFNQGKLLILQKKYLMAKNKLLEAALYAPDYVDAHYYLAVLADRYLRDYKLAKQETDLVLYLEPSHSGARALLKIISKKDCSC